MTMEIQRGYPTVDGFYVGYIAYLAKPDKIFPHALQWKRKGWYFTGSGTVCVLNVRGFLGPLPTFKEPAAIEFDL